MWLLTLFGQLKAQTKISVLCSIPHRLKWGLISVLYVFFFLFAAAPRCCLNNTDNCIFTCLLIFLYDFPNLFDRNIHNKKSLVFNLCFHFFISVLPYYGKWLSYPVCFGWPPEYCLSCRACMVLLCRPEWSIFPRVDAGTSYKMSLLHTLSLERFPAPPQPEWKQFQTVSDSEDALLYWPSLKYRPTDGYCGYKYQIGITELQSQF